MESEKSILNINVYTCQECDKLFPDICNSAPPKNGALCVQCGVKELRNKILKVELKV